MDRVLPPHAAYAAAYLNDVIIHSDTWAEHMQLVAAVLESLSQAGFRTNLKKCAVGRCAGACRSETAIASCLHPKTKREVLGRLVW